jgi:hypothetical protein
MNPLMRGFDYRCEIILPSGEIITSSDHNLMPQEGVDFFASLFLGDGATPNANWYMGLFENNYVPTLATKAADLPGVVGECTAYAQAARPAWQGVYDGVSVISNLNNKTKFTLSADKTIYGGFIVSSSTKAGGGGVLVSIARFASPKALPAGTEFGVVSEFPLIPTDF